MNWHAKPLTKQEVEVSSRARPALGRATNGHRQPCVPREPLAVQEPEDTPVIFPRLCPRGSSQASSEVRLPVGWSWSRTPRGQGAGGICSQETGASRRWEVFPAGCGRWRWASPELFPEGPMTLWQLRAES